MTSEAITRQYEHALKELRLAEKKFEACKNPKSLLARMNDVATWRHVVRELQKRYGFGVTTA